MNWTKGKWKLDQRSGCVAVYPAAENFICLSGVEAIHYCDKGAKFNGSFWDMDDEAKANAALIAAAPELYEALALFMEAGVGNSTDFSIQIDACRKALAALAKARGEV